MSDTECCSEPGFITIGNDYADCGPGSGNCPGGGESGLDQSPLWDCPKAQPDGTGGNCSVFETKTGLGPNPDHVLQIGDGTSHTQAHTHTHKHTVVGEWCLPPPITHKHTQYTQTHTVQSTSLFVHDAESLAQLALLLNRTTDRDLLLQRASLMKVQLLKLWDPTQRFFADRFILTGEFSNKLTPTAVYALLTRAATEEQVRATVLHLTNSSELCVSADFATHNSHACYWGLPSVSRSDISFMKPLSYIYWRGNTWGPMTILTYWSLAEYAKSAGSSSTGIQGVVLEAMAALAKQKEAQMMYHWRLHRHICENYSPYSPDSTLPPGNNQINTECTGVPLTHSHIDTLTHSHTHTLTRSHTHTKAGNFTIGVRSMGCQRFWSSKLLCKAKHNCDTHFGGWNEMHA